MSRNFRARYYDLFAHFYDGFVALHASDRSVRLRGYLADRTGLRGGDAVLDLCTGTGAMLPSLHERVGAEGRVFGLDFSKGMLRKAKFKLGATTNLSLVQADAAHLPFKGDVFDVVTCSHAFYELKGKAVRRCLQEVSRVVKPSGCFVMMEHDVPRNGFIRMLFYIRIVSMGFRKALEVLRNEEALFREHFGSVERRGVETGRSKILVGKKAGIGEAK